MRNVTTVDVLADNWSLEAPYTQRVDIEGMSHLDTPVVKERIEEGSTAAEEKAVRKAASLISYVDSYDGYAIITCIRKKPVVDFKLDFKAI